MLSVCALVRLVTGLVLCVVIVVKVLVLLCMWTVKL